MTIESLEAARVQTGPDNTGGSTPEPRRQEHSVGRFLRKDRIGGRLAALIFLAGCAGALALVLIYHWPRVNVLVFYFSVRPSFVWFGMLFPALLVGAYSLRWRWIAVGCAIWLAGVCATEEVVQVAKPYPSAAREEFWVSRMAFRSYMERATRLSGFVDVPLRIVTWNVHLGGSLGREGIAAQLAELDPDIVFFQEFRGGGSPSLAETIRKARPFAEYHMAGGQSAVLSRFPVTVVDTAPSLGPVHGVAYRFEIGPGVALTGVNVHLPAPELRTQVIGGWSVSQIRGLIERSARDLGTIERVVRRKRAEGPVLLAGDFNLPPNYPHLRQATASLKDPFRENGYGWGKTVRPHIPVSRIDMIFVPRDARVYYATAVDTRYSDHRMALAEVVLRVPVRREESRASDVAEASSPAE